MWSCVGLLMGLWFMAPSQEVEPKTPSVKPCRADFSVLDRETHRLSMRFRVSCPFDRKQFRLAFAQLEPSVVVGDSRPQEFSVDLGRIVEHPWLSTALATAALNSKEWDSKLGKPRQRNINQYVGALLRASGVLDSLLPDWALQSARAEKVLVQPASKMVALGVTGRALVPYDAILWLHFVPDPLRPPEAGSKVPAVIPPAKLDE